MQATIIKNQAQINWTRFNSTFVIEVKRGNDVFTSTAVALGKRMLVTAAHCVDCAEDVVLIIGDDYKKPDSVTAVSRWIVHPSYNPSKSYYENDLAIIYIDEDLPHFTGLEVVEENVSLDDKCFLERIGFGGRNNDNVRTWTNPTYQSVTFNKKNFVLKDSLSVVGDSGGPVYKEENGILKLIGIHSTLESEDKTYVVNLGAYKGWIEGNLEYRNVI
jgi:V8-like Glu-specific endopeptidase